MSMISTETVGVATVTVIPESAASGFSVPSYAMSVSAPEVTSAGPSSGKSPIPKAVERNACRPPREMKAWM